MLYGDEADTTRNRQWKVLGPSDVSLELIAASGQVGIHVMFEFYQRIVDGLGMSVKSVLNVVISIP